ncbi:hypothetical protein II906_03960 [bacterium]|nr:hypothetical protein [bacterium]
MKDMRVVSSKNQITSPGFKGALNNKILLKGLETISNHSATFIAATSAAMAIGVRPLAVSLTPKTDKRNKQYAAANSISSGIIKFGVAEAIALPIEHAVKKIDKNPQKFLNEETINNLKDKAVDVTKSKNYGIITQLIKQGTGVLTAIPKSMLTVALIPVIMDRIFASKEAEKEDKNNNLTNYSKLPDMFNKMKINDKPSFKGGLSSVAEKGVSKLINNKALQNFVKNHNFKEENLARNVAVATDLLLTGSFIHRTHKSKKIEPDRKKALIYNNIISTGAFLACGVGLDKLAKKGSQNFVKKFSEANKNNPMLKKYLEGLNIVRSTLIFAGVYYAALPVISTFTADKIDKFIKGKKEKTD